MKIITWNIAALPKLYNLFGNPENRINKIIKKIKTIDADIVFLQEVFTTGIYNKLKTSLSNYYIRSYGSGRLFWSGLIILSKYPIISQSFSAFKHASGEDIMVEKGYLSLLILKNNKKIKIINTHLNADSFLSSKSSSKKSRSFQLKKISNILKNCKYPCILGGDFNTRRLSFNYPVVKNNLDYIFVKGLRIGSKKVIHTKLSDHNILVLKI